MANFPNAPVYVSPVTDSVPNMWTPAWQDWFQRIRQTLNDAGGTVLTHNELGGIQGGQGSQYYHLTALQQALFTSGTAHQVLHGSPTLPSWSAVDLAADVTGVLAVARGGTGLTSGTSGGVLGFTAAGTVASSVALSAGQVVVGGGAGATPSTLAAGSQYQVLTMGASTPAWGAVNLASAAAVTGVLGTANGGTGTSGTYTQWGVLYAPTTTTIGSTAAGTAGYPLIANSGAAPTFQQLNIASSTNVTGVLSPANGGTGVNNASHTLTLGGNVTFSGAFTTAITLSNNTTVTLPTSGTLVGSADIGTVTNTMLAGSITASKLVGTDIATVGTVTLGTWNAGVVGTAYGGTGNAGGPFTSFTPTFTITGGTGTSVSATNGYYQQIGKFLFFQAIGTINFSTAPTGITITLPNSLSAFGSGNNVQVLAGRNVSQGTMLQGVTNPGTPTLVSLFTYANALPVVATGDVLAISGCIQVQ